MGTDWQVFIDSIISIFMQELLFLEANYAINSKILIVLVFNR